MKEEFSSQSVAALVVTYFPDTTFTIRLNKIIEQFSFVLIVDNGSSQETISWRKAYSQNNATVVIRFSSNLGVATALNRGITHLIDLGFRWVVTFDQDSTIQPDFLSALLATLATSDDPTQVALVGACRRDIGAGLMPYRWLRPKRGLPFFERVPCERVTAEGVTLVITSGTLTNLSVYEQLGPFRDDFFIDHVDFEYCLRARLRGYTIMVSCEAQLFHQVGHKQQQRILGITLSPTFHPPVRRYYQFRNSIDLFREYGLSFPHWFVYHTLATAEIILTIAIFEKERFRGLRACVFGILDGLFSRMGPNGRSL